MNKKIYLYNDGIGAVEYIQHVGDDRTIVNSARVSFGKEVETIDEKDKKLIKYLIKHKHTSTLEHCFVTFRFTVPLFVRSQHHRHRTWSYNEISRRYTEIDLNFYEPQEFRTQHKSNRQASNADDTNDPIIESLYNDEEVSHMFASEAVREHHLESLELFNKLLEAGVCRE
jgi:thymidylate synthase (FAD)